MTRIVLCVVCALVMGSARARSAEPVTPASSPCPVAGAAAPRHELPPINLNSDQYDGMNRAVELLESSGHREAALELRHRVTELRLAQTLRQLEAMTKAHGQLQKEIESLRPAKDSPQVVLSFHVLELSRTKLQNLGMKLEGPLELIRPENDDKALSLREADQQTIDDLIAALKDQSIARTLAEPTLVTVIGRGAEFHSGGELPIPIPSAEGREQCEFKRFGTEVEALPRLTESGELQLKFRFRISELDQGLRAEVGGRKIPGFRTRQIDTGVTIKAGQGVIFGGLRQTRVEAHRGEDGKTVEVSNELETLFIVIPTLVTAMAK